MATLAPIGTSDATVDAATSSSRSALPDRNSRTVPRASTRPVNMWRKSVLQAVFEPRRGGRLAEHMLEEQITQRHPQSVTPEDHRQSQLVHDDDDEERQE